MQALIDVIRILTDVVVKQREEIRKLAEDLDAKERQYRTACNVIDDYKKHHRDLERYTCFNCGAVKNGG